MRKRLFGTLLFLVTFALAVCGLTACGDKPSDKKGAYYLSVYEAGAWTTYTSDADVPAASKFVKGDDDVYALTVTLEQGKSVKIAQVGSETIYGYDAIFTVLTVLTKGDGNAISVGQTGTFELKLDVSEGTITYKFTPQAPQIGVASVAINEADFDLTVGGADATKQLSATATLDDDTDTTEGIIWESSNPAVATVSETGLVTAVSAGTAEIKAKAGDEEDFVTVNVNGVVTLNKDEINLNVNGTETLVATEVGGAVKGAWSSTDTAVATVDENGKVTAVAAGTATIRLAYTPRTGATPKFATCQVTVNVPVTGISINGEKTVAIDSTAKIAVNFAPANATNKNYSFAISAGGDEFISVAKNPDGKLAITGVAKGTATITVTSEDGNFQSSCIVTVVEADGLVVNMDTSLNLKKASDKTATLSVDVVGGTVESVEWENTAPGVATVTGSGEEVTVESKGYGTTTITATITIEDEDEPIVKTCTVRVAPDHFFLYGVGGWATSDDAVPAAMKSTDNHDGTYSITYELDKDASFRIGYIDGGHFFTSEGGNWVGYGYSHIKSSQHITGGGTNNLVTDVKGVYTFKVDLTGASPKLIITCAPALTSISLSAGDNSTLYAGEENNSTTVTLTVNPSDAAYDPDSDITWTCESNSVTLNVAENKKSATVTAKDEAAGGTVTVTCTVKGISETVDLTVVAQGEHVTPVSEITFEETVYTNNVNVAGNLVWTATVNGAAVNSDATNQGVTYSVNGGATLSVDKETGAVTVTATAVGTYTVTATAAGDTSKTAELTVTFYSNQFYLVGGDAGWGDVGAATVGKENYTFTGDADHKVFTLESVLTKNAQFQIIPCGAVKEEMQEETLKVVCDWGKALTSKKCTISGDVTVGMKNNQQTDDFIVTGETGVYTITIDLSDVKPAITVTRIGNTPVFTATVAGVESGASMVVANSYKMSVVVTLTEETKPEIVIKSGEDTKDTTEHTETLAAGQYRFDIVCNANGNVISATATIIESTGPKVDTTYTIGLYSANTNIGWTTPTTSDTYISSTVYYDALSDTYTAYFSVETQTSGSDWAGFGLAILTSSDSDVKKAIWKEDLISYFGDSKTANSVMWVDSGKLIVQSAKCYMMLSFTVDNGTVTLTGFDAATTDFNPNPTTSETPDTNETPEE